MALNSQLNSLTTNLKGSLERVSLFLYNEFMKVKDILRWKPWLKLYNAGNITTRLQKSTNGNAFIVYNLIQGNYELHTIQAEYLSGDSYNASIPMEVLNQWIIEDYNSNDFEKYVDDIMSNQQMYEYIRDEKNSQRHRDMELAYQLGTIERVMGTKI